MDLPHGECNALLLDRVVEFNFPAAPERFEQIAQAMGLHLSGLTAGQKKIALVRAFRDLRREAGLDRSLGALGVKTADIPILARNAMHDPCMITNPRLPNSGDIEALYAEAL